MILRTGTSRSGLPGRSVSGHVRAAGTLALVLLAACDGGGAPAPPGAEGPPPSAAAAPDAASRELLDRLVRAERTTAFHGSRRVSYGPEGSSRESRFRVVGMGDGRTVVEWSAEGAGDGATPHRTWKADGRFPWVARPELLLRNYTVTLDPAPGEAVAFRDTRRVRVTGTRPGRPSVDLLVDAETWLVLAETWRTPSGEEWYRGRFESLAYGAPDDPPTAGAAETVDGAGDARPPAGFEPLAVTVLPDGFERVRARSSPCGGWIEDFTDGLAGLSVLQRPADADAPPAGELRRHRWLGGLALAGRLGDVAVTVHGGLEEAALRKVVEGLASAPREGSGSD